MSRNSIKAVDLYCRITNWNSSIENGYADEVRRWTIKRDRALASLRKVMTEVTQEGFVAGRWGNTPTESRVRLWNEINLLWSEPIKTKAGGVNSMSETPSKPTYSTRTTS